MKLKRVYCDTAMNFLQDKITSKFNGRHSIMIMIESAKNASTHELGDVLIAQEVEDLYGLLARKRTVECANLAALRLSISRLIKMILDEGLPHTILVDCDEIYNEKEIEYLACTMAEYVDRIEATDSDVDDDFSLIFCNATEKSMEARSTSDVFASLFGNEKSDSSKED